MIAVVEIANKQYLVQKGSQIQVQRLKGAEGKLSLDKVLVLADDKKVKIGTPYVEKARVEAECEGETKGKKIIVYKLKRRKKYRRKQGHRQIYTTLKITRIVSSASHTQAK